MVSEEKEDKKEANVLWMGMYPSNEKESAKEGVYNYPNKDNKVSMVKINSELYNEVVAISKADNINYPSAKNFIEQAIKNFINSIKYNIENQNAIISRDGKLTGSSKNEFTGCLMCDRMFLNEKSRNKEGKRICPRCSAIIKHFSDKV